MAVERRLHSLGHRHLDGQATAFGERIALQQHAENARRLGPDDFAVAQAERVRVELGAGNARPEIWLEPVVQDGVGRQRAVLSRPAEAQGDLGDDESDQEPDGNGEEAQRQRARHPHPRVLSGHGHTARTGQTGQRGARATHVRRPCAWIRCVVRVHDAFGRTSVSWSWISSGSSDLARPRRWLTRNTWVSTAMASSPNALPRSTFAVLRPTPGNAVSDFHNSNPWMKTRIRDE